MQRIQRVSKFFKWVFQILFVLLPLGLIFSWFNGVSSVLTFAGNSNINAFFIASPIPRSLQGLNITEPVLLSTKLLGFVVSLIPLSMELLALYFLICLFKLFERCEIFSYQSVRYIKYIGYTLLIAQLVTPVYQGLLSVVLTWHNLLGERTVMVFFSGTNGGLLLMSLLIILISWIMAEGQKIKEEQAYTV